MYAYIIYVYICIQSKTTQIQLNMLITTMPEQDGAVQRVARDELPVVEHGLAHGLAGRVRAQVLGEEIGCLGMSCFRIQGVGLQNTSFKPLTFISLRREVPTPSVFEGQSTIMFKSHILKHHIPELPKKANLKPPVDRPLYKTTTML